MTSSRKFRVLHVFGKMDRGGAETWIVNVLRNIDRRKYQFDFVVSSSGGVLEEDVRALGAEVYELGSPRNILDYARHFRQVVEANGPYDALHSHMHHFSGVVLGLGRLSSIPVRIAHSHNDLRDLQYRSSRMRRMYYSLTEQAVRRFSTVGLAASKEAAASLFGEEWEADESVRVLHCGIDLAPFVGQPSRKELKAELGIPQDSLVIGHVGSFSSQKNHSFLLEVFATLHRLDPESYLVLVGNGPLAKMVEDKVRVLGLGDHVRFLGARSDVPSLMLNVMDVFVFPSLFEGLGLVLLEAQAAGLPCVVSDTLPRESEVITPIMHRVSLQEPLRKWSLTVLEATQTRISVDEALGRVALTDFNLVSSTAELLKVYEYGVSRK